MAGLSYRDIVSIILSLGIGLPGSLLTSQPVKSQVSTVVSQTTPASVNSNADETALRNARYIADQLLSTNAAGMTAVANNTDFKQAVADLRQYVKTVGATFVNMALSGHDIPSAMIIAGVAGELTPYKTDYDQIMKAVHDRSGAEAADFATNKLAEKLAQRIFSTTLTKATGSTLGPVPAGVQDAAKVGARFIMAYEGGAIDHVAPNGLRPLLNQNPTTKQWLDKVDKALQATSNGPVQSKVVQPTPSAPTRSPSSQASTNSPKTVATVGPIATPAPSAISPPLRVTPGGISLTKAAAERMPLNLSIEGAFVKDGRIVLSGRKDTEATIDAALFLTALRATCEGRDPYFSLDPDDTSVWLQETKKAGAELLSHIESDIGWTLQQRVTRKTSSILKFRTFSASQSYPAYWSSILNKYPNLRSRLVFGPEWLRQTRFGEILYKADVLLKELAGGAPALGTSFLRASKIDDYISATQITAARGLLFKYHNLNDRDTTLAGGRIWYDLTETSETPTVKAEGVPSVNSELHTLLRKRHLLPNVSDTSLIPVSLPQRDGLLDISQVYPRMYVRIRDPLTFRDGTGSFPGVDELVAAANTSPQKYAAAYREYQALVEVFRAYVAAVHAIRIEPRLCLKLPKELMDAEKIAVAMPAYHPTDFALTVGWYEYSDGRFRRAIGMTGGLYQGGVSVGATALFDQTGTNVADTPVLRELKLESSKMPQEAVWLGAENRRYISFTLDSGEALPTPEQQARPRPSLATVATKPEVQMDDKSAPAIAGRIGRFDLHNGARIQGENLASVPLNSQFAKSANLAQSECAQLCSDDKECIAFEIDERRSICGTFSSISGTIAAPNWTHGIWK